VPGRAAFTDEQWDLLREAPEAAGLIVRTAEKGVRSGRRSRLRKRMQRRASSTARVSCWTRSWRPAQKGSVAFILPRSFVSTDCNAFAMRGALLDQKASEEADGYVAFVVTLAEAVAAAHKEGGENVSRRSAPQSMRTRRA
jgi:hypothetical protein